MKVRSAWGTACVMDCTMDAVIYRDITGVGTQTVSIYFNDVLFEAYDVTFS